MKLTTPYESYQSVSVLLPYPPSVNHYYRVANGRGIKSAEARDYPKRVKDALKTQKYGLIDGPVWCDITVWPPDNRKRDNHNLEKGIFDALNGILYADDSWIVGHTLRWANMEMTEDRHTNFLSTHRGCVEIKVNSHCENPPWKKGGWWK